MAYGAREIPRDKWLKFFKKSGLGKNILISGKNERVVVYRGRKIHFSILHNTGAMKISYMTDIITQKLKVDGYEPGTLEFEIERKELRKLVKQTTGY